MKKFRFQIFYYFVACSLLVLGSCKDEELEDFPVKDFPPSTVTVGSVSGGVKSDNEFVRIPVSIALSTAATSAFEVQLTLNNDTLQNLDEEILDGAEILPTGTFTIPNAVSVEYGAASATFEVSVSVTTVERYYGKKLALGIKLSSASKGNIINSSSNTAIIILNTSDLISEEKIHYLSIANGGGGLLEIQNLRNYTMTSEGVTIPLGISLNGQPGRFFTVKARTNSDTIATLVSNGTLPAGTVALDADEYGLDSVVTVPANSSSGSLTITVPESVVRANLDKKLAIAVSLAEPSRHVLDYTKNTVVILIHPDRVIEVDVTPTGTLTVNKDNGAGPNGGEGSLKLVDNEVGTKLFYNGFFSGFYMQLAFPEPVVLGAYTMTSGGDAKSRDPKDWQLEGSNDLDTWKVLDTRRNEEFLTRTLTRRFNFNNSTAYKYYRLTVTANAGSTDFQMAEWRLIKLP